MSRIGSVVIWRLRATEMFKKPSSRLKADLNKQDYRLMLYFLFYDTNVADGFVNDVQSNTKLNWTFNIISNCLKYIVLNK